MKRILIIMLLSAAAAFSISAQETEQKQYLPEAGDWSVGFNAKPVLYFVGNLFNNSSYISVGSIGGEATLPGNIGTSIMGKYMITDNFAFRANVGFSIANNNSAEYVIDDEAYFFNPLSEDKVIDYKNNRSTRVSVLAGVEYRVGKKRVQGVFGGGLLFGVSNTRTQYSYGNAMTDINPNPSTSDFYGNTYNPAARVIEEYTSRPCYHAGLVGIVGVEWFFAPKVSLGAEVSVHAAYKYNQQSYKISEEYNAAKAAIEQRTDLSQPPYGAFSFGTENLGGALNISFYF